MAKSLQKKPWRFWINDDDDYDDAAYTDIPKGENDESANAWNSEIDGMRDLVDFFPVQLNLKAALDILPADQYRYVITHSNPNQVTALKVVDASILNQSASGDYLKSLSMAEWLQSAATYPIHSTGYELSQSLLDDVVTDQGYLLIEGVIKTNTSILLKIERISDNRLIAEIPFHINISSVMDMIRYKFVMPGAPDLTADDIPSDPPNWPDADRNGKHFIFVHGYNVNDTQAKGWGAEFFKRIFWSGSNARFSAFAWHGYQGQLSLFGEHITSDYQINLDNAFGTAKSFKQFLDLLGGDKAVAAHSMGNILVGSAMHDWGARPAYYYMLNAAAAKECYDETEVMTGEQPADEQEAKMVHQAWIDYPRELRASEWHNLPSPTIWPASDKRRTLTWKNRLRGVIENGGLTNVYHFYSSGEEVLNNPETNNPPFTPDDPFSTNSIAWTVANKSWAMQEKKKGYGLTGFIHTSNYGGWLPNLLPYNYALHVPDIEAPPGLHRMRKRSELPLPLTDQWLLERRLDPMSPFFNRSNHAALYDAQVGDGSLGSNYARDHRNTLISEMIPCTTFAAGRNGFAKSITSLPASHQIDMDVTMKTNANKWPLSNENENDKPPSDPASRPWLHSDIREKSFSHNWQAYQKFIEIGNLNEE